MMKDKILNWLLTGHVGASSKAMACCFANIDAGERYHPCDPGDLSRCIKFLDAVPEARSQMDKLRSISAQWDKLVDRWDELEETYRKEFATDRRSTKRNEFPTYNLIQDIMESVSR